jgi:hypothetical protein
MSTRRRGARRRDATPSTDRELLAYNAGRRLRSAWQPPIGSPFPTQSELEALLDPRERLVRLSVNPARWWRLFWRGWADRGDELG